MNDVEVLDLTALGGVDTFTLNDMRGTGFLRADVDLSVGGNPDGAEDIVTIKGTEQADDVNVDAAAGSVVVDGLQTSCGSPAASPPITSRSTPSRATTRSMSTTPLRRSSTSTSTSAPTKI